MATILEDQPVKDERSSLENRNNANSRQVVITRQESASPVTHQTTRQKTEGYEVVFVVDESNISQKAFDFAVQTARNFSAKLVLLYVTEGVIVPPEYMEYANSEGIRDFEWTYNDSIANDTLRLLGRRADEANVNWESRVYYGDRRSAIKSFTENKKAIVVVDHSSKKFHFGRFHGFTSKDISKLGVPIVVV